ncbi:uncharacterized protein LOC121945452 [Plectropomus leopardus]|uniref:uncharacterized protein LOC121945452 n=1 Tax=Plectropomus leopardus TaxID=160734 RepID=UPI001C4C8BFC|nr:uncharacterized protein LOC121945452 [Plectropomus leopardus]XP_042345568.1 uncharacterized protein LOC121945452 [Plectropomus leopardus]
MSAELYRVSEPGGNDASLQGTTVGGSKPLHRFSKGQPKLTGITVLILGSSFLIVFIAIAPNVQFSWTAIPSGFLLGVLFIICGVLYILTEHNLTKRTVTISLALSIVTILSACWTALHTIPNIISHQYFPGYEHLEDNMTEIDDYPLASVYEDMGVTLEQIILFYSIAGAVVVIVMSCLAGSALRSTKSQAVIVMTTSPTESPADK